MRLLVILLFQFLRATSTRPPNVIFAVNCGGDAHVDRHGIRYAKDPLKIGIASDYGKQLQRIGRVPPGDEILYQTERYHHTSFGYDVPVETTGDGDYVMVLKFSEVYFQADNMKVFDVVLNGDHTILSDLDIHDRVGHGVAYDEIVPFEVRGTNLLYNGQESEIRGGKIRVEFIKGYRDNPKINAIYVIKGTIDEIPDLEPVHVPTPPPVTPPSQPEEDFPSKVKPSGPRVADPYEDASLSQMILPVFIAIGAFIPILICLCRL